MTSPSSNMSNSRIDGAETVPFVEANSCLDDTDTLQSMSAENGYLFFRGLVAEEAARLRDDMIRVLKAHGFVEDDATKTPRWTGVWPEGNEALQKGEIAAEISDLRSVGELSEAQALEDLLERLLGGKIFNFVENRDRIRRVFPNRQAIELAKKGGPVSPYTPGHQDDSFYNVPFVSVWIALMEIDERAAGLQLRQGSHKLGKLEHWRQGLDMLGVANNTRQAEEWARSDALLPAAMVDRGDIPADDSEKVWIGSDYGLGDALVFHPRMVHRGNENVSETIRLASDFRYQREGDPAVWWARHRLSYRREFLL